MRKCLKQYHCRQHEQKRPTKHHIQQCVAATYSTGGTCYILIIKHVQKPKQQLFWSISDDYSTGTHVGAPPHSSDVMMHTYTSSLAALPKAKTVSAKIVSASYTVRL